MRKTLLAVSFLLPFGSVSWAQQETVYENWVAGFGEFYNADSDKPDPTGYLTEGHGVGFEIGSRFNEQWGMRFEMAQLNLNFDDTRIGTQDPDHAGLRMGIDAMYFAQDDLFYVFAGLKHARYGNNHEMGNVGLGKHWKVDDKWRIISEAALYYDFGQSHRDVGLKFGVAYTFGEIGTSRGPKDSDRDGVYDNVDQCPNTPFGTPVDAKGCNDDLDGDGVVNAKDQCPETPAGTKVNAMGCNWDKDGDGVANEQDKCPNTPPGTKVGAKGCALALDSDEDGVLDSVDKCPDTPLTDKVDESGCSIFTEQEVTVNLRVLFANNSAEIDNPGDDQFQEFADFMARFPNTQAEIEGHTSAVGQASYNQSLSEKRANAVRQLLIDQYGIDSSRLTAVGYGETRLLDDSNTPEASTMNRRIEARVTALEKVKELRD